MTTMTKTSARLYDRYQRLRGSDASILVRREAYNDWFKARCDEGRPPDSLNLYSADEAERFWARTVPGPDGHIYWTGGKMFRRNDGMTRKPQRWAWVAAKRALDPYTEIENTCGSPTCVNVDHMGVLPRSTRRVRFPDERAFNAAKVLALQLGHTPSYRDWDRAKPGISAEALTRRFGNWGTFVQQAGLVPQSVQKIMPRDICEQAILAMLERYGRPPSRREWDADTDWLKARGFPTSTNTIRKRMGGSFATAVRSMTERKAA